MRSVILTGIFLTCGAILFGWTNVPGVDAEGAATVTDESAKVMGQSDVMSPAYRAFWNENVQREIDERIEKYRKADATVTLDKVKPGTKVEITLVNHAFLFGAHIFNFDQLGSDAVNKRYRNVYGPEAPALFNSATVAFYWKKFEPEPGHLRFAAEERDTAAYWNACAEPKKEFHWRRPASDPVVAFCESRGIQMNGHTIIWGNRQWQHPEWLPTDPAQVDEMERLFTKRITELAEHYGNRLNRWDVVNESAEDFKLMPEKASRYGLMPMDYAYKAFQVADRVFPKSVELNINDYSVNEQYAAEIKDLVQRGCRIDNVGIQMHLFNPAETLGIAEGKPIQTPEIQRTRLTAADATGKPLHLSEITITAPNDDARGRAIQAEVARNLYRYWFSWPSMMGITWWNIVDDCGAPGEPTTSGLFTRQMEPKPSYDVLNDLINHQWRTRLSVLADAEHFETTFRGFKGKYRITWTDQQGETRSTEFVVE